MKETFLSQLSEQIVASGIDLATTLIVLPNKRAQRMLLTAIAEKISKPVFAPTIYTIDELMAELSDMRLADHLELLVRLFNVYNRFGMADQHDFSAFLSWAPAFLDDISDMDVQLQDCASVFRDLAATKSFEIRFGQDAVSRNQQETIAFYELLSQLYEDFVQTLRESGVGYAGLLYRDCAERADDCVSKLPFKHYVFAGFHVLSASELQVVRTIQSAADTHFFFDLDPFYCDFQQKSQFTTAYFLRKICSTLSLPVEKLQFTGSQFATEEKEIQIVGTSKTMNQIYYAIETLERIRQRQGNLDDTALVLADESLLMPLLAAYKPEDMNITMGYPFKATPVYTLLNTLLEIYQNGYGYVKHLEMGAPLPLQHADFIALIRNPLVKRYMVRDAVSVQKLIEQYDDSQRHQYLANEVAEFDLPHYTNDLYAMLPETIAFLTRLQERVDKQAFVEMIALLMEKLEEVAQYVAQLRDENTLLSFSALRYLVGKQTDGLSLPMKGEARHGLQVMGLLETRTLDFKNVIILSVNEGVLPSGIKYNSLLPYDLKYSNQEMENYLYKDQVYAYHFFRLLQRAEQVTILYDNDSSGSLAEKSRFVTQLEFRMAEQRLTNIHLSYPKVSFDFRAELPQRISIPKTEKIRNKIAAFTFSPTSLNDYISCPLKFYLKNICRIYPSEPFDGQINENTVGTWAHDLFQRLFDQVKERQQAGQRYAEYKELFDDFLEHTEARVAEYLLSDSALGITPRELQYGQIYLTMQILVSFVQNYIARAKGEFERDEVTLLANERQLSCTLQAEDIPPMHLKGTLDRLQRRNGQLMVLDYKTGKVRTECLSLRLQDGKGALSEEEEEVMFGEVLRDGRHSQMFQLLVYAVLCKNDPEMRELFAACASQGVVCGIVALGEVNKRAAEYFFPVRLARGDAPMDDSLVSATENFINRFEEQLCALLTEIYCADTFEQCADTTHCGYCKYHEICNR